LNKPTLPTQAVSRRKSPYQSQIHVPQQHKSRFSSLRSHAKSKLRLIPIYSAKDAVIINAADGLSVTAAAMKTLHHCLQINFLGTHA
jgi:hypothetical protein